MALSIGEVKTLFQAACENELPILINEYKEDARSGVQKCIISANKRLEALEVEKQRIYSLQEYEREYEAYSAICGIDEVGRGPLAGPVVAGAVILPKNCDILYINDSKKLTENKREELYDIILEKAIAYGLGFATPERIDEINILQATYEAMRSAIKSLQVEPDLLLNDAVTIPQIQLKQVPIIKGDRSEERRVGKEC